MLLMKIPSAPRGLSRPPTIVKPSDFLPGPFSNATVWNEQRADDLGLRGSVQKLLAVDLSSSSELVPLLVSASSEVEACSSSFSSSHRFMVLRAVVTGWGEAWAGLLDCLPTSERRTTFEDVLEGCVGVTFLVNERRLAQSREGGFGRILLGSRLASTVIRSFVFQVRVERYLAAIAEQPSIYRRWPLLLLLLLMMIVVVLVMIGAVCPAATNDKIDAGAASTTAGATVEQLLHLTHRQTAQSLPEDVDNFIFWKIDRTGALPANKSSGQYVGHLVPIADLTLGGRNRCDNDTESTTILTSRHIHQLTRGRGARFVHQNARISILRVRVSGTSTDRNHRSTTHKKIRIEIIHLVLLWFVLRNNIWLLPNILMRENSFWVRSDIARILLVKLSFLFGVLNVDEPADDGAGATSTPFPGSCLNASSRNR
uniref:Uncharacterized protein n=1 Tax=Anopheles coluzzii TaxID=1518534 RepID=A0A8W7PDS8_ANOCL